MIFAINTDKDKKKPTETAAAAETNKDKALVCVGVSAGAHSTVNSIPLPQRGKQTSWRGLEDCSPVVICIASFLADFTEEWGFFSLYSAVVVLDGPLRQNSDKP